MMHVGIIANFLLGEHGLGQEHRLGDFTRSIHDHISRRAELGVFRWAGNLHSWRLLTVACKDRL